MVDKPQTATVESDGRPDSVVSTQAWSVHKQRNRSFIVESFHGQLKSRLQCPECSRISITFDPFLSVSAPIPQKQTQAVHVLVVRADPLIKPQRLSLCVKPQSFFFNLKQQLCDRLRQQNPDAPEFSDFWAFGELYSSRLYKFYDDNDMLAPIRSSDCVVAYELSSTMWNKAAESDEWQPKKRADFVPLVVQHRRLKPDVFRPGYTIAESFGTPRIFAIPSNAKVEPKTLLNLFVLMKSPCLC